MKVIFKKLNLSENIEIIKDFYNINDKNLINYFYIDNKEDINTKVSIKYNDNINIINNNISEYNNIWDTYNNLYIKELCKYLNINFDEDIICYVGVLTTFPRYLDKNSFCIGINLSNEKIVEVCAHEILHFVWFKKFKEIYPNINSIEYDNPYLAWEYSELVVDPILNSKDINKILNVNVKSYDYFYELKCMNKIKEIYNSNNTIEDKIKLGYEYLKEEGIK